MKWGVVVLAGGIESSARSKVFGHQRKALAQFGGKSSLEWTLDAVKGSGLPCVTVTGSEAYTVVRYGDVVHEGRSAIENASSGLAALPALDAVLFLPADSPLLRTECIEGFITAVEERTRSANWLAAGLSCYEGFVASYPEVPAKAIRLREGKFLSGGLYGATPQGFEGAIERLSTARDSRKSQISLALSLGLFSFLRYFTGRLSILQAEAAAARMLGNQAIIIPDCSPESCLDFDTEQDYQALVRVFHGLNQPSSAR